MGTPQTLRRVGAALAVAGVVCLSSLRAAENVYLRVDKTGGGRDTTKQSSYGTSEREYTENREITITLRNNNKQAQTYTVEWYFVAKPLKERSTAKRWVFDYGEKELALEPAQEKAVVAKSADITGRDSRESYVYYDRPERTAEGDEFDCWYVRVLSNGKAVRTASSRRASPAFEASMTTLIDEFGERLRKRGEREEQEERREGLDLGDERRTPAGTTTRRTPRPAAE